MPEELKHSSASNQISFGDPSSCLILLQLLYKLANSGLFSNSPTRFNISKSNSTENIVNKIVENEAIQINNPENKSILKFNRLKNKINAKIKIKSESGLFNF
jgi:hypothetical protein